MKKSHLIVIFLILASVCVPVLAISKSDLISQYKMGNAWPEPPPPIEPAEFRVPNPTPTSRIPSPEIPSWFVPSLPQKNDSFLQPSSDWKIFDDISIFLLKKWEAEPKGPSSYAADLPSKKPNIYLYSDRDINAQVKLRPEKAITVSEPVYQPGLGWQAEIRNGSLNGKGDFLFYEAVVPDDVWQKKEGYVIKVISREHDMASMLGQYGFNDKETTEFIEYWVLHLDEDVDYVFYPQETGAVDQVMLLSITPKPDHVRRIWFYAEPLMTIPELVISPEEIVRDGFHVVEWGVMIR
jgi:hypothetical protein